MKNRHVGYLIIGVVILFLFVVMSFNQALQQIVDTTCTHGKMCPMHATLRTQKMISYSLMGILALVGVFMVFFMKDEEKIIQREIIKETHHHINQDASKVLTPEEKDEQVQQKIQNLDEEEKQVMSIILRDDGATYQSDLIKETKLTKVKISRILDRLQGKGLIERKRRGMTNMVVVR
ncbi:MarR family transcriptional regulator [Candidatus Woesearchaeota archaeon]|nr:MarR family transcriptional regulator [Candidatus Woesearchaeota archaeon]